MLFLGLSEWVSLVVKAPTQIREIPDSSLTWGWKGFLVIFRLSLSLFFKKEEERDAFLRVNSVFGMGYDLYIYINIK